MFDGSPIIGKNNPPICMPLSYYRTHLTGNLAHNACGRKLCQVSAKGADGGRLHRGHHFCIERSRDIQRIDAWKNLAHGIDECLH